MKEEVSKQKWKVQLRYKKWQWWKWFWSGQMWDFEKTWLTMGVLTLRHSRDSRCAARLLWEVGHIYSLSPLKRYKPGSCRYLCAISLLFSLSAHFLFAFNRLGNVMHPLNYNGYLNVVEVPKARLHKCLHVFLTQSTESIDCSFCLRYGKFPSVSTISCNSCKSQGCFFTSRCIMSTKHSQLTALDWYYFAF